jgi:multicomponent Na+:H+ antiporter subunit B
VASAFILIMVAYGSRAIRRIHSADKFSVAETSGLLAFIALGFLGISSVFFYNFLAPLAEGGLAWLPFFGDAPGFGVNPGELNTGGTLPPMNLAVGLEVLAALALITFLLLFGFGSGAAGGAQGKKGGK